MQNVNSDLINTLNNSSSSIVAFIPRFLTGLIVLVVGIIIATFLKQVIKSLLGLVKFESFLNRYGVPKTKEMSNWSNIIAEIVRWFVIIIFLIPTAEVWGLGKFVDILNEFLLYIPNVFVAVLILLVGFVVSRLAYDVILASLKDISRESARTIATISRWAILIFAILIALNQLGIASDLIRILFTGFVALVAIAGGLAFGLGGKDIAREILDNFRKKI